MTKGDNPERLSRYGPSLGVVLLRATVREGLKNALPIEARRRGRVAG